ncbi:hypothetical protein NC652_010856 [Populus alba x Populus x berolinensis]|nr:hypothetical protein NC652_010856 [Populus alba x Populus x berolinensis]
MFLSKLSKNKLESYSPSPSPSWELLFLVAQYLDPKSLATASCVSKSWPESFSSEDIWRPICSVHYPSVYNLKLVDPALLSPPLRYCLHGSLQAPASKANKTPPAPKGPPLRHQCKYRRVFHFIHPIQTMFAVDIDLESSLKKEAIREIKVTWNVVLRGWKAVFNMMESCSGKASFVPEAAKTCFPRSFHRRSVAQTWSPQAWMML